MGIASALLVAGAAATRAQGDRETAWGSAGGRPMLAVVSISDQRITVYGAEGKLSEASVSTGAKDYETPAGIFSIVQKKEFHTSNLYQDGEMPFMQRITWTGVALHAGALPGHPASHGCVRLPTRFAQQLFDMTELGMRVVIAREDMAPADISHPLLFKSRPVPKELGQELEQGLGQRTGAGRSPQRRAQLGGSDWDGEMTPGSPRHVRVLEAIAAAREAEVEAANRRLKDTRAAAARATSEAAAATRVLRAAESNAAQAEGALKSVERQIETATKPEARQQAEAAKEKVLARAGELQAKLETIKAQEQAKRDAAESANAEARAAMAAKDLVAQAAVDAARSTMPVSVFVSRKMQRLYVRRGTHPVFEAPVRIGDADKPIGTFVFTAFDRLGTSGEMRWSALAMYKNPTNIEPAPKDQARRAKARAAAASTDVAAAKAALDRIGIGKEALDIIVGAAVLPGSSLIVSDEGPSRETGKDTDFVVVLSGEPQGALTVRQREPVATDLFDEWGSYKSPGGYKSPWGGSSKGGSPFFWKW